MFGHISRKMASNEWETSLGENKKKQEGVMFRASATERRQRPGWSLENRPSTSPSKGEVDRRACIENIAVLVRSAKAPGFQIYLPNIRELLQRVSRGLGVPRS